MKELIYHCEDITPQKMKYQNQEELEIKYKKMIETNDKILRLSQSINKYDEAEIVENTYFKLFCYNDFLADIFKTDFLQHFKIILVNNGFSMSEVGEVKNLNYSIKRKQKALMNTIKNNEIDEFIGIVHEEITDKLSKDMEDFIKDTFLEIIRPGLNYELLLKRHEIIGLQTKDDIIKYKDFLQDEHTLTNLFNFQKLFRTDDYINKKIEENNKNCQKVKNLSNIYTKINLLRVFEKVYNIERLDLNFTNISLENKITEDKIELIYNVYRFTKSDLSTVENVIKLYINMITNICGDLKVVLSGQKRIKKVLKRVYTVNTELLIDLLTLTKLKNPYLKTYDKELIKKLTNIEAEIEPPQKLETPEDYAAIEAEGLYNTYLFGKFGNKI
jgi:hypothetical protein